MQHQSSMIQDLKYLRTERNIEKVERGLSQFVEKWKDKETEFVQYFTSNYINRKQQWAVCYRNKSVPDATAHAEAFHNILKRVYSNKRNRYMRTLLEKLMQIEEDMFIKFQGWVRATIFQTHQINYPTGMSSTYCQAQDAVPS